jgi:hypothetical protein
MLHLENGNTLTQIVSSENLIAGALGGDLSDMDEAFPALLLFPISFTRLDGTEPEDVRLLAAGVKVFADPSVEPRRHTVYVVIDWEVFAGDAYADELEETTGRVPMIAGAPYSSPSPAALANFAQAATVRRADRVTRRSVEHAPYDSNAALLAVLGHSVS